MISLKNKHSFRLPSKAGAYFPIEALSDLDQVLWGEQSWILGDGSNTLFTDDFVGPVIHNRLTGHRIEEFAEYFAVAIAAGENWHYWVSRLVNEGIYGLENLALIPGSVGAAPVQNIGAYGVEVSQFIAAVEGIDLATKESFTLSNEECKFAYRDSVFKQSDSRSLFITEVTFHLPKHWRPVLDYPDLRRLSDSASAAEVMQRVIEVRQAKLPDPNVTPNAGSFFKNPVISREQLKSLLASYPQMPYYELPDEQVKLAAGWLIDQAGLKSARKGGAGVHQQQALVLINDSNATGADVLDLARYVQRVVRDTFAVELQPEVRLLGNKGLVSL
jgi:UDP-N-acetylmuramate dehydrogenase